ncbi:hypothetical protein FACS189447_01700 [Spirochaetia bacterium]|nr:hypothetical protein FACS189447_01700 [Spirochaetia bacterium]
MQIKEWAKRLDGIEYPANELDSLNAELKVDGIIAVFGHSDDLMEFRGVINYEEGAWEGVEVLISSREKGTVFIFDEEENRDSAEFNRAQIDAMQKIKAVWAPEDIEASWKIETDIPHETFNIIEDEELFCQAILIHIDSIKGT